MAPVTTEATTFASCHPSKQVQKLCGRLHQHKLKQQALFEDIDIFFEHLEAHSQDLAVKHGCTLQYMKQLLTSPSLYKLKCKINMHNTIVHNFHLRAKAEGGKLNLEELRALADKVVLEPSSTEEEAQLQKQLTGKHNLTRIGLHGSNLAATIMTLYKCMSTHYVMLFSHGYIDDGFIPSYAELGDSMDFFVKTLKIPGLDILCRFEGWSVNKDQAPVVHDTLAKLHHWITSHLENSLVVVKNNDVYMSYKEHETNINLAWKLHMDSLQAICDGLCTGKIHWVYMQPNNITALEADVKHCH
ncbi:hypothetical protein C8R44DRAFT_872387 [Mycena epipterygia]|nr:hypothetical protein C8R44DRAFT_872387 [Mycena epipterygia]